MQLYHQQFVVMATSAVFDMIEDGVFFMTPSRGITFINLAAQRFLRISKADALGIAYKTLI